MDKKNIKVASIFIMAAVLLFWGYNFLKGKDIFSSEQTFYAIYTDASGLSNADPVYVNGLQVGQVSSIAFHQRDMNKIVVGILYSKDQPIPKNSIAKIISTNLMGTKAISIQLGDATHVLQDGDTMCASIESSLQEQVEQNIGPLKNKAEELINAVDAIVSDLHTVINSESSQSIGASIRHLESTLSSVSTLSGNLDKMVDKESKSLAHILSNVEAITTNLNNNSDNLNQIIQNFHQISDSLAQANIVHTIRQADQAVAYLSSALQKIDSGQGSMGLLLNNDSLYWELNKSAHDLNLLLEDIKKNPKRYLKFSVF